MATCRMFFETHFLNIVQSNLNLGKKKKYRHVIDTLLTISTQNTSKGRMSSSENFCIVESNK